jgi:predicted neuraminidase
MNKTIIAVCMSLLTLLTSWIFAADLDRQPGIVTSEFIFESAPFPSCHASTIVETKSGLAAAWFGGTKEGHPDVGIWLARHVDGRWTAPVEVANGVQPDGKRFACFNPVLFQTPGAPLMLFYKRGGNPQGWLAFVKTSQDDGATWSEAAQLPDGFIGPVKNKPVLLADGSMLCGSSTESHETPSKWRVHFERTADLGKTWTKIVPAEKPAGDTPINAIQPSILFHPGGKLQAIGRTREGRIFETWSGDGGRTWSALSLIALPNPNSGTDAVTLRDSRHLLVYNHTAHGRSPLNVAVSRDGRDWQAALVLENQPGEYSYPAIIQTSDGLAHITYTWKRQRIKHVVVDPAKLEPKPMPNGEWPK